MVELQTQHAIATLYNSSEVRNIILLEQFETCVQYVALNNNTYAVH